MTRANSISRLSLFALPALVAVAIFVILFSARWTGSERYSPPNEFVGCYADGWGNSLELSPTGRIMSENKTVGTYRIVAPVGGKHGYLVQANSINIRTIGQKLVSESGTGGFLWPVTKTGELHVIFAPDTEDTLRKRTHC
jgi:hypothetical protein